METKSRWNHEALWGNVPYDVVGESDGVMSLHYPGEPYQGHSTRVSALMGVPAGDHVPGVVCIHGGGGKAFVEWVKLWNARGYAAIAMNLGGQDEKGERTAVSGPDQTGVNKFDMGQPWTDNWTYHAIAAVVRAHSILRSHPRVDVKHIGATGISWGGYLSCIVAGVDPRFACVVPVYGCGHLRHNGADGWLEMFAKMSPEHLAFWDERCDPKAYLPRARMPMLFVTGTNDEAYPMDSHRLSYAMPAGPVSLCIRLEMHHSHPAGWSPGEIERFMDHHLRGGPGLPMIGPMRREGTRVSAAVRSFYPVTKGYLLSTSDSGKWVNRKWRQVEASVANGAVSATIPRDATVWYLAVEDDRGGFSNVGHDCW